MAGIQRLLAIAMAFLLTSIPNGATPEVLGIIFEANRASLGGHSTSEGTSVYDGDRLSTDAGGTLRLRSRTAMLYLANESNVIVHNVGNAAKELDAELISGTVVLSAAAGAAEIVAHSVRVRSVANTLGVIQVRILGAKELFVFARRGPAEISYRGESETIGEGKSYRMLLYPVENGTGADQSDKKTRRPGKTFFLIIVGPPAAVTGWIIWEMLESPDRP